MCSYKHYNLFQSERLQAANEQDEIDIEILGGDPANYQTNIFAPQSADGGQPLYGAFSSVQPVAGSVQDLHEYAIDWTEERIVWSLNGKDMFTLGRSTSSTTVK